MEHLNAGRALRAQGRYADAEREYLAGVNAAEQFGARDPRLARTWNNLAALYLDQGRYAEAGDRFRLALALWESVLGPEHPDVAATLTNLAAVERALGRFASAEALLLRAVRIHEKTEEAAPLLERSAAIFTSGFGPGVSGAGTPRVPRADTWRL